MKRVFFLLFFGLMGFYSSEGIAARLDLTSHLMLSNPGYAKHIEVQCYLVTREQVAKVFANGNLSVEQKTNKELYQKDLFLLVRCKNNGQHAVFGTLKCLVPNCSSPIAIDLATMWANQKSYDDYVIYLGPSVIFSNNELSKIKYEWDCLYTM